MSYISLIKRNPQFARLWAAQAVSLIGDWFNSIVIFALVSAYSNGSGAAISLLLLARFLPPLLLSPVAGVLLDRYDRQKLLIFSDVARIFIVLGFLLVDSAERLWLLYLLTVLQFSLASIFEPGRSAFMPSVTKREDLIGANVLGSLTWSVALAIGGALGGIIAGTLGTNVALILDALTFVVSAVFIASIRPDHIVDDAPREGGVSTQDFVEGLRYVRAHSEAGTTLLVKFGGSVGAFDTLLAVYATVLFPLSIVGITATQADAGALSLGILWTAFGVGAVLGPLIMGRFNDGSVRVLRRLIIVAYVLISLGWFIYGGASTLLITALATVIKAMGGSVYWTYSSVILQKTVDDRFLGRVFALDMAGFQLAVVLSVIITGAVLEIVGTRQAHGVTFWTALVSLVPLVAWTLITRWLETRERRKVQAIQAMGD